MSKGEFMADPLSSLVANSTLLANASSNVANMNTRDYQSIRTTLVSDTNNNVRAITSRTTAPGAPVDDGHYSSNVELPQEFCDMIRAKTGFEATLCAISTREEMMLDLMDILTKRS
ncbi:MAG TPA: hypothetical protein ENN05_04675 [Deltaproteobacteria bacterium]|nr:hypothetical protein [Deltaproteobacteria bacterium]